MISVSPHVLQVGMVTFTVYKVIHEGAIPLAVVEPRSHTLKTAVLRVTSHEYSVQAFRQLFGRDENKSGTCLSLKPKIPPSPYIHQTTTYDKIFTYQFSEVRHQSDVV